jgi:hypothetical protein
VHGEQGLKRSKWRGWEDMGIGDRGWEKTEKRRVEAGKWRTGLEEE